MRLMPARACLHACHAASTLSQTGKRPLPLHACEAGRLQLEQTSQPKIKSGKACAARVSRVSNRHMQTNRSAAHAAKRPRPPHLHRHSPRSPPTPSNTTSRRRAFVRGQWIYVWLRHVHAKRMPPLLGSCALLPCHKQHRPTCAMQCTAQPSATPCPVFRWLLACAKPPLHARQAGYARSLQSFFHLMKTKCVRHYQKLLAKCSPSFF